MFKRLTAYHTAKKGSAVHTALALHKTALQQRALAHIKDHESFLVDKTIVEAKFRKIWGDKQAKIGLFQTFVDGVVVYANTFDSEGVKFFVSEKSLQRRL